MPAGGEVTSQIAVFCSDFFRTLLVSRILISQSRKKCKGTDQGLDVPSQKQGRTFSWSRGDLPQESGSSPVPALTHGFSAPGSPCHPWAQQPARAGVSLSLSPAPAEPSTAMWLSPLANTAELGSGAPCPASRQSPPPQKLAGSLISANCSLCCAHLK